MICPRTGANCPHGNACGSACGFHTVRKECGDFNLFTSPPKPTMAEIERLVDESEACAALCWGLRRNTKRLDEAGKDYRAARAALLAAIRAYGEG